MLLTSQLSLLQSAVTKVEKAVLALAATSGQQRAVSSDLNHLDASSSFTSAKSQADDLDMLTASEWPGIPPEYVLQTPSQCRTLWRHFVADSELSVQQAMATQQAQRVSRPLLHQRCGICSVLPETVVLTLLRSALVVGRAVTCGVDICCRD